MPTQGTATVDFGATPVDTATFAIVDATLSGLTYAEAWIMRDSVGDNNEDAHEQLAARTGHLPCSIAGTTLTVVVDVLIGFVTGQFKLRYGAN
jgi:hypothetical protein